MVTKEYAIAHGSRVLVTGANGYIASNIVDQLLDLGFRVRGTVRAEKPWLQDLFDQKYGPHRFDLVVVPTLEADGAFDKVLEDVAGVIHVASDVSFNPDPEAVIPVVVKATVSALEAASKHPSVKRFVLTSSTAAALWPIPNTAEAVDENNWNEEAVQAAYDTLVTGPEKPVQIYAASKVKGEQAAWKFVEEQMPAFTLNTVLPNMTFGRILAPQIHGSTMGFTRALLKGDDTIAKRFSPQWYVDVEDAARLHVIALLDPQVRGERIFAAAGPFSFTGVFEILRKLRPQLAQVIPPTPENEGRDLYDLKPTRRAEQLLKSFFDRPGWVSLEDSLSIGISDGE